LCGNEQSAPVVPLGYATLADEVTARDREIV